MDEIKKLKKNELKDYINKNGGFIKNRLENIGTTEAPEDLKDKVPEGAIYFEGIASDGSLNMNGYKIRPSAFAKAGEQYINDFGGLVYYMHDMDVVIGKTLAYQVRDEKLYVQGYVFDEYAENKISKGLVADLSTGHYNVAVEYENTETNETLDEDGLNEKISELKESSSTADEYIEKFNSFINKWVLAVTELIWIEYSFVTVGSNTQATVTQLNSSDLCTNAISKRMGLSGSDELSEKLKNDFLSYKENNEMKNNGIDEKVEDKQEGVDEPKTETEVEVKAEQNSAEPEGDVEVKEEKKDNALSSDDSLGVQITDALREKLGYTEGEAPYLWVMEIYPSDVVYNIYNCSDDKYYRASYSISGSNVTITSEPVEVESVRSREDKVEQLKAELGEVQTNDSNIDDKASENDGGTPEVKEDNSLGIQTKKINELKVGFEEEKSLLTNEVSMLKEKLTEANDAMKNAVELINTQSNKIDQLQELVDTANEIVIKNGLHKKKSEEKQDPLLNQMTKAYNKLVEQRM